MAGTERSRLGCAIMKRFFFDLAGEIRAHDFMGHECSSKKEAKQHAAFIARRIGTEGQASPNQGTASPSATSLGFSMTALGCGLDMRMSDNLR